MLNANPRHEILNVEKVKKKRLDTWNCAFLWRFGDLNTCVLFTSFFKTKFFLFNFTLICDDSLFNSTKLIKYKKCLIYILLLLSWFNWIGNNETCFIFIFKQFSKFYNYNILTLKGIVKFHHFTILDNVIVGTFLVVTIEAFLLIKNTHRKKYPLPLPIREFLDFLVNG